MSIDKTSASNPKRTRECPFCREKILEGAIKCRYCQSMLVPAAEAPSATAKPESPLVIVDRGIVNYLKVASGVLAIMVGITVFLFGFDLWKGASEVHESVEKVSKSERDVSSQQDEIRKHREAVVKSKQDVEENLKQIQGRVREIDAAKQKAQDVIDRLRDQPAEFDLRIKKLLEAQSAGLTDAKVRQIALALLKEFVKEAKSLRDPDAIASALKSLESEGSMARESAEKQIMKDMTDANEILSRIFETKRPLPTLVFEDDSVKNAFPNLEKNEYHAPLAVKDLSDFTYHEMAHFFISNASRLSYEGQPGALFESFADALGSLIKQELAKKTAATADWVIGRGSISWLKDERFDPNGAPLRSLRAPGTAYDDPVLGKDPQRDRYSRLYTGTDDLGGIHFNSGIPNKAFYEVATRIGTDKAAKIWVKTLRNKLRSDSTFKHAAEETVRAAREIYGANSPEQKAVEQAWEVVEVLGPSAK